MPILTQESDDPWKNPDQVRPNDLALVVYRPLDKLDICIRDDKHTIEEIFHLNKGDGTYLRCVVQIFEDIRQDPSTVMMQANSWMKWDIKNTQLSTRTLAPCFRSPTCWIGDKSIYGLSSPMHVIATTPYTIARSY